MSLLVHYYCKIGFIVYFDLLIIPQFKTVIVLNLKNVLLLLCIKNVRFYKEILANNNLTCDINKYLVFTR